MSFQKITFKNYKSFEQEQVLEIKPITIVIGKNNSGKTALLQLPLMLHAWMNDRNGILSTRVEDVEFAKQMKGLIFNQSKENPLEISFSLAPETEGIIKIEYVENSFGISYLEWKYQDKTVWKAEKEKTKFKITTQEYQKEAKVEYTESLNSILSGILPSKEVVIGEVVLGMEIVDVRIDEYGKPYNAYPYPKYLFNEVKVNVQYFAGIRHIIEDANLSFDELKYSTLDAKGEFAAQYLYKDEELLENIKDWYIKNMDGWGIGLEKNVHNEGFYLYLEDFTKPNGAKIPITQTGRGITQALPLVVTALHTPKGLERFLFLIATSRKNIIIEQPELHIHPAAHGNLVELFVESALKNNHNYILETHSEVMLLRVRRLVAEGKLKPEQVAIYWVDTEEGEAGKRSFLTKIEVDEEGNLGDWPAGIFSEDYNELMHIRKARKK